MITIYGTRGCGFCKLAVDKCKKFRLEYEYKDIGISMWYMEYSKVDKANHDVPCILVDGKYLGNYNEFIEYTQELLRNYDEMA